MKKSKVLVSFVSVFFICVLLALSLTACSSGEHKHKAGEAVKENVVEATCTSEGSYDEVVYCSVCKKEISRTHKTVASGHTPVEAVKENEIVATCKDAGSYDEVVYCSVCNEEISRTQETTERLTIHNVQNGVCVDCGAKESTAGLEFSLNSDGNSYTVTGIGTCTESDIVIDLYKGMSVTSIGWNAFRDCTSFTSVTIGNSVTSIGGFAFYKCTSLTSVTIPDSVTSIGREAFYWCKKLTSVTIPDSVTSIGEHAFEYCTSLTGVYISDIAKWCAISFSNEYSNPLYYAHNLYLNGELVTELVIPDGVTSIGYSFAGCTSLTSVTIPESVTSIGDYAFYKCTSLTSVTIPESVTSIGDYAFQWCTKLTSITIPDSVTIPESVTSIGYYAFQNCTGLKGVYISDIAKWCGISFSNVYSNPLEYAHNLYLNGKLVTDLVIPDGVTSIGKYAFYRCTSLTSVTIPDSVTWIDDSTFRYCTSLTSITIPDSVTGISEDAFDGCTALTYNEYDNAYYLGNESNKYLVLMKAKSYDITSCTINENCKVIYHSAFSGCSSLTSITIPNSITRIGGYVFQYCTGFTSVYYKGTASEWSNIIYFSPINSNSELINATRYYYSETAPVETGNYWHYGENGEIVVWGE